MCIHIYIFIYLFLFVVYIYLFIFMYLYLFIYIYLFIHLFIYLCVCECIYLMYVYAKLYLYVIYIYMCVLYIYTYRNEHRIWEVPCFSTSSTEASTGAVRPAAPCEPRGHLAMGKQRLDSDWIEVQGKYYSQWIGLRENLQETIDFPIKYGVFL